MKIDPSGVSRILVIKLRAIGDVLLSTVVLRNLRIAFPDSRIDFLTELPSRDVIEGNRDVDSVLAFDRKSGSSAGLIMDVRRRKYDLVIDLFANPRSALITRLSGARTRVGFPFGWRKYCYNILVEPRGGKVHNTEFNLDALRGLGIPIIEARPRFPLDDASEAFARAFFEGSNLTGERVIALNAGGGWYTKRWRAAQFAALGDRLASQFEARIVVIWGPGERTAAEELRSMMHAPSLLIPPANLKELGAILRKCTMLVTNDSGPMHIAAAVGTPVVAIFGPTNPQLQGPVGAEHEIVQHKELLCLGCNYTECPIGNPCMEELSVDDVFTAAVRLSERIPNLSPVHERT